MRLFLTVLVLMLAVQLSLIAQPVKYSNEFLSIGVGSRAMSMGKAVAASSNDLVSGYWNPAGLARMEHSLQASFMHSEYFAGIAKYDYGAFAKKIDSVSTISLSVIRFGVDDIPNTINLINSNGQIDYSQVTRFSAQDYGIFLSYGRKLGIEGLTVGGSVKVVRRLIGDFANSWGFGIDGGVQYHVDDWRFGLMARDVSTTFNAWSYSLNERTKEVFEQTGNEIPENSMEITMPRFVLGGARLIRFKKFTALAEANLEVTTDGFRNTLIKSDVFSIDPTFGLELGYNKIVFLRGGINNIQQVRERGVVTQTLQPNFGVGVDIFNVRLDYALTNVGEATGLLSHVFTIRVGLNPRQRM
jgi:hypothetical protein